MSINILIVDDEPEMERLITQKFRRKVHHGEYAFSYAPSGDRALEILTENTAIDILLLDINMPGMDGLSLLAHIRQQALKAKAVIVSAYDDMDNIRVAMNRGAFDFVVKPIDFKDLEITIQKAFQAAEMEKEAEVTSQKLEVTTQELAESAAREEVLKAVDEMKNRVFTQISHEFRTPLTVILGMAEQIELQSERWLKKGIAMIKQNGNGLLDLINQLLELRKLEAGKSDANYIQGDIISYLEYLVASFESLAELNSLTLTFRSEISTLNMDHDPDKLLRIITNLLSNAIKYTEEGGAIEVGVQVAGKNTTQQPDYLIVTISDTGIGIPADSLPHIFDTFFQVEGHKIQGTGIGLALTQELIHLMGGDIQVESQLGQGTTFHFQLPIKQLAPRKEATPELFPSAAFRLSQAASQLIENKTEQTEELPVLLIIEDNPDVIQYLLACLEGHYRLQTAADGDAGIAKALQEVPDLIISDVMMPGKNGYEVCNYLKTDERTSHIPIVLLTAKADEDARITGFQQGADAYLAKPFKKKELFVRLDQLLQLRQKLQRRYSNIGDSAIPKTPETSREDRFIKKIQDILETNLLNTSFGITDLCREMELSRSQLHNKIKALTNRSTSLYLRYLRLIKARELLLSSNMNVSEVAYEVGFNDPGYFSRAYIQEFGEAPSRLKA